jgi:glycosyltransferase involved in cell wall biosynthesis
MRVLILANTRFKGGISGGDAIYESFKKYWPCDVYVQDLSHIDYKPFFLCYLHRLCVGIARAVFDARHWDVVYSSSDFAPDSVPGFIYKLRGCRWVAGFFLKAFRDNPIHFYTQQVVRKLMGLADMVIVTNPTMYDLFPEKKKTWINGGIDLSLAGLSDKPKIYDAVFCGRIHPSKGIDELLEIWDLVREKLPKARLAIIGDGDLGVTYIKHKLYAKHGLHKRNGIDLLGYMGNERFEIYKQSKVVLYPTPLKYDHFSMAPVEAMACGCPMVTWMTPSVKCMMNVPDGVGEGDFSIKGLAFTVIGTLEDDLWTKMQLPSFDFAQQFDYQKQSIRVYEDICRQLTLT